MSAPAVGSVGSGGCGPSWHRTVVLSTTSALPALIQGRRGPDEKSHRGDVIDGSRMRPRPCTMADGAEDEHWSLGKRHTCVTSSQMLASHDITAAVAAAWLAYMYVKACSYGAAGVVEIFAMVAATASLVMPTATMRVPMTFTSLVATPMAPGSPPMTVCRRAHTGMHCLRGGCAKV